MHTFEEVERIKALADEGNPEALFILGTLYLDGDGVPRSMDDAFGCFREAAIRGETNSAFNLGLAAALGEDMPQSWSEASYWYSMAANSGHPKAMVQLGILYSTGNGVPQSYLDAASWYAKAADLGDRDGMMLLADLFEDGLGVPQSHERAEDPQNGRGMNFRGRAGIGYQNGGSRTILCLSPASSMPEQSPMNLPIFMTG